MRPLALVVTLALTVWLVRMQLVALATGELKLSELEQKVTWSLAVGAALLLVPVLFSLVT